MDLTLSGISGTQRVRMTEKLQIFCMEKQKRTDLCVKRRKNRFGGKALDATLMRNLTFDEFYHGKSYIFRFKGVIKKPPEKKHAFKNSSTYLIEMRKQPKVSISFCVYDFLYTTRSVFHVFSRNSERIGSNLDPSHSHETRAV